MSRRTGHTPEHIHLGRVEGGNNLYHLSRDKKRLLCGQAVPIKHDLKYRTDLDKVTDFLKFSHYACPECRDAYLSCSQDKGPEA